MTEQQQRDVAEDIRAALSMFHAGEVDAIEGMWHWKHMGIEDLKPSLGRLVDSAEQYVSAYEDDPLLYLAVIEPLIDAGSAHTTSEDRGAVMESTRTLFASKVPPAYIVVAYSIASIRMKHSRKSEAISVIKEVLEAEHQRFGDPQVPVEIIAELIGDRVKESVRFALL